MFPPFEKKKKRSFQNGSLCSRRLQTKANQGLPYSYIIVVWNLKKKYEATIDPSGGTILNANKFANIYIQNSKFHMIQSSYCITHENPTTLQDSKKLRRRKETLDPRA